MPPPDLCNRITEIITDELDSFGDLLPPEIVDLLLGILGQLCGG